MVSDEGVRQVLFSVFRRTGSEGVYTKLANSDFRARSIEHLPDLLEPGELPVIYLLREDIIRCVITTRRLLFFDQILPSKIRLEAIARITPVNSGANLRSSITELNIILRDGSAAKLPVEPGQPAAGVWNVLLNRMRHGRKRTLKN